MDLGVPRSHADAHVVASACSFASNRWDSSVRTKGTLRGKLGVISRVEEGVAGEGTSVRMNVGAGRINDRLAEAARHTKMMRWRSRCSPLALATTTSLAGVPLGPSRD